MSETVLANQYLAAIAAHRRPKTAVTYRDWVRRFDAFLVGNGWTLATMPGDVLSRYCATQRGQVGDTTVALRVRGAKLFIAWAKRQGTEVAAFDDRPLGVPAPRVPERTVPTTAQLAAYARMASTRSESLCLALWLLPATGMRIGELAGVRVPWLHCELLGAARRWWIDMPRESTKTDKRRIVPIHPVFYARLAKYVLALPEGSDHLFPVAVRTIQKHVTQIGEACHFHAHPHLFRHTFSTRLGEAGVEGRRRNVLMGHADKTMEDRYDHQSIGALFADIERVDFSWMRGIA